MVGDQSNFSTCFCTQVSTCQSTFIKSKTYNKLLYKITLWPFVCYSYKHDISMTLCQMDVVTSWFLSPLVFYCVRSQRHNDMFDKSEAPCDHMTTASREHFLLKGTLVPVLSTTSVLVSFNRQSLLSTFRTA